MLSPDPHTTPQTAAPRAPSDEALVGALVGAFDAGFPQAERPAFVDARAPSRLVGEGLTSHLLDGFRIVPLASFWWGGTGVTRRPRVRNDSVLMLIDQGAVRIDLPRQGQSFVAGQIVFVPSGFAFAAQPAGDADGAVLRIPAALTRDLAPALPTQLVAGHASADLRQELAAHLTAIQRDAGLPLASARQAADARLRLLSILLQRHDLFIDAEPPRTTVSAMQGGSKRIVRDFIDLAARELSRGRTLSDMAQSIGVNLITLDQACQAQRGQNALEVLYALKFETAMTILRGSRDSLGSIAARTGYTGVAHLNRAFVAATGRSAESFRETVPTRSASQA